MSESKVEMPRAAEEAYSLGVAEVTPLIADIQRRTLLAAARQVAQREVGSNRYLLNLIVAELERLAEQAGREKC